MAEEKISSSTLDEFINDLDKIDYAQLAALFNNEQIFDKTEYTGTRKDGGMLHINPEAALKLKLIVNSTTPDRTFSKKSWYKRLQLFYNAYVLESLLIKQCGFEYLTGDHAALVTSSSGVDQPDFKYKDKTIEFKIYGTKKAKATDPLYHNADYVLIFRINENKFEWLKRQDNGKYCSIKDEFTESITLPTKTEFNFVELLIDYSQLDDFYALFAKKYSHFLEAFGSRYSNDLDISKALINKEECIQLIREKYGYEGPIKTGGFYIMPDGSAVKSENHADIDKFLIKNGYISGKVEDYGDGSQFMDAINCVRIRRRGGSDTWILPYMILPEEQLTAAQYEVLENWVSFVLSSSGNLSVQTLTGKYKNYHYGDSAKQVIADIHTFYKTAILEGFEYELLYEPDIDQTDYKTDYALQKGYYDQF